MLKQEAVAKNPESITNFEQVLEKAYTLNDANKLEYALIERLNS